VGRMRGGAGSVFQSGTGENRRWRGRWRAYRKTANGKEIARVKRQTLGLVAQMSEEEAREKLAVIVADDMHKADVFGTIRVLKIASRAQREKTGVNQSPINGMLAELTACCDLARKGFEVFKAVNPIGSCDLVVWLGSKGLRVEVKHGVMTNTGRPICNATRNAGKYDVLALVTYEGTVHYFDTTGKPKEMGDCHKTCGNSVVLP
jgi:hypothetical protein